LPYLIARLFAMSHDSNQRIFVQVLAVLPILWILLCAGALVLSPLTSP
jgi:hypothetical protein